MMNWHPNVLLAPILAFCLMAIGFNAESATVKGASTPSDKKPAPTKSTKKPKPQKFVGNISTIDAKTGAVAVKGTESAKSFMAQDSAKDALERLAVGDRVRVQYSEKDGKLLATSVRRMKMPQSKTKNAGEPSKTKSTNGSKGAKEKAQ